MEDKGNAKQKKKIIQVKTRYQEPMAMANFSNKIIRIRACAALDVAYLKQGLEGREKDSLAQLR